MYVIPVMDLMSGQAVRAAGGRRELYAPLADSCLVASSDPVAVATAYRDGLGAADVYLADLDAIERTGEHTTSYRAIADLGMSTWIDAGVRTPDDACRVRDAGARVVVAGLETVASPEVLVRMVGVIGADALCFSLDLRDGVPIIGGPDWADMDAEAIAGAAADVGVCRLIVLDLARVGANAGTGTNELCARLSTERSELAVYVGGGIRSVQDLEAVGKCGASGALVSTALHDGRITRADLDRLADGSVGHASVHS